MDKISEIELKLLRGALSGMPYAPPADTDWKALAAELNSHRVAGIVCGAGAAETLPDALKQDFQKTARLQGARFYRYLYAQEQLLALLEAADIPTVILKGTAAAVSYPHPEVRSMGDIDFLVPPERFEEAYALLAANGYQLFQEMEENGKHIGLEKDGTHFELHRSFGSILDPEKKGRMDRLLRDGMAHAVTRTCCGSAFPMLPPLENGITLLYHIAQHLRGGLGLRQIIDWMQYVHGYLTDALWETRFKAAAESFGIVRLAVVVTRMCRLYLGFADPVTWPERESDADRARTDALAEELMAYILADGNFGRKQDETSHAVIRHLSKADHVFSIFGQMQKSGLYHHKALRQNRILRVFAWIPGGVYYARRAFGRKGAWENLKRERSRAKEKSALLQRLGVDEAAV